MVVTMGGAKMGGNGVTCSAPGGENKKISTHAGDVWSSDSSQLF